MKKENEELISFSEYQARLKSEEDIKKATDFAMGRIWKVELPQSEQETKCIECGVSEANEELCGDLCEACYQAEARREMMEHKHPDDRN